MERISKMIKKSYEVLIETLGTHGGSYRKISIYADNVQDAKDKISKIKTNRETKYLLLNTSMGVRKILCA